MNSLVNGFGDLFFCSLFRVRTPITLNILYALRVTKFINHHNKYLSIVGCIVLTTSIPIYDDRRIKLLVFTMVI